MHANTIHTSSIRHKALLFTTSWNFLCYSIFDNALHTIPAYVVFQSISPSTDNRILKRDESLIPLAVRDHLSCYSTQLTAAELVHSDAVSDRLIKTNDDQVAQHDNYLSRSQAKGTPACSFVMWHTTQLIALVERGLQNITSHLSVQCKVHHERQAVEKLHKNTIEWFLFSCQTLNSTMWWVVWRRARCRHLHTAHDSFEEKRVELIGFFFCFFFPICVFVCL